MAPRPFTSLPRPYHSLAYLVPAAVTAGEVQPERVCRQHWRGAVCHFRRAFEGDEAQGHRHARARGEERERLSRVQCDASATTFVMSPPLQREGGVLGQESVFRQDEKRVDVGTRSQIPSQDAVT